MLPKIVHKNLFAQIFREVAAVVKRLTVEINPTLRFSRKHIIIVHKNLFAQIFRDVANLLVRFKNF